LAAVSLSSGLERFRNLREVFLFDAQGAVRPAEIESVWQHRGLLIFKFRGVDSISEAERLKGAEMRVPRQERAPLAEGEYYQSDLIGCEVIERANGERLGTVTGWQECGGPALLEVKDGGAGEPMLIPFARAICTEIDLEARRILVDLPEGLKELSRK
jgi:16S rRNA processing protein RimM